MAAGNTIEAVEDAILARLEHLKADASIGLRTLDTYQGELETEQDVSKLSRAFPAIWVVYGGSNVKDMGPRVVEEMTWILFLATRSLRDEAEARRGGATGCGSYALCEAARNRLANHDLGLTGLQPLQFTRQENVWFGKGISIYGQQWRATNYHLLEGTLGG